MVTARIRSLRRRHRARTHFKIWAARFGCPLELISEQVEIITQRNCLNLLNELEAGGYRVHRCQLIRTVVFNIDKVRDRRDRADLRAAYNQICVQQ